MSSIILRPREVTKSLAWEAYGSASILAGVQQEVLDPATPARTGGKCTNATESSNALALNFAPLPAHTPEPTGVTIYCYGPPSEDAHRIEYGVGVYGDNAAGFTPISNGWNALTTHNAIGEAVFAWEEVANKLWVEIQANSVGALVTCVYAEAIIPSSFGTISVSSRNRDSVSVTSFSDGRHEP